MASTLLEQTRAAHEEIELLERSITSDFKNEVKGHKEKLLQSHRVRKMVDAMQDQARKLVRIYEDKDRSRREEIAALRGDNPFSTFYDRLKEVRDYHRRYGVADVTEMAAEEQDSQAKNELDVAFSGEEGLGRFLDLHELHRVFSNAKFGRQLDYLTYLRELSFFSEVPAPQRITKPYQDYLRELLSYLQGFYERTQPLGDVRKAMSKLEAEFSSRWEAGEVPGWTSMSESTTALPAPGLLDLDAFESVEELEALGPERVKAALSALGLKCGGTPRQRAERLMSTKGKTLDQLDKKLFAAGAIPVAAGGTVEAVVHNKMSRASALLEAKVSKMLELLKQVQKDTIDRTEKKLAQTYEEVQADQEEAEADEPEDDSDEEEAIYNPLDIPLGWDGKPIPYWLYKLHGLNQEFACEICGNKVYRGRRDFEKHFNEWQHINGMKALGIPNGKDFFEVTKIEDALALWEAIKTRTQGTWTQDADEEFEDAAGNVYNKKTYEDLKRQGLL